MIKNALKQLIMTKKYLKNNSWTYFQVLEPPFMPPDTIWGGTYTIENQLSINDTLYSLAPHPFSLATTLRYDGKGHVWARIGGRDVLYLDFTLEEGQSYPFVEEDGTEYEVSLERLGTIEIGGGRFDKVISLHFKWTPGVDNDRYYAFGRGAGIVTAVGGGGEYQELYSAAIGGRVITSTERTDEVQGLTVSVYPNPSVFNSFIEIRGINSGVIIQIVDVLGRQLREYRRDYCRNECHIEIARGNLTAGLYFVLIETATGHQAIGKLIYRNK
jgi:hypothetical protein